MQKVFLRCFCVLGGLSGSSAHSILRPHGLERLDLHFGRGDHLQPGEWFKLSAFSFPTPMTVEQIAEG